MRNPYAADHFLSQVQAKYKSAEMEPIGDVDGFGVHRSFRFSGPAGKWLAKVMPYLEDPRIAGFATDKKGKSEVVTVLFSYRSVADRTDDFPLDAAETVADAREVPVEED